MSGGIQRCFAKGVVTTAPAEVLGGISEIRASSPADRGRTVSYQQATLQGLWDNVVGIRELAGGCGAGEEPSQYWRLF